MFKPGDLAWHKKHGVVVEVLGASPAKTSYLSVEGYLAICMEEGLYVRSLGSPICWTGDEHRLFQEWCVHSTNLVPLNYNEDKDKADVLVSPTKENKNA